MSGHESVTPSLAQLRREYALEVLDESCVDADPTVQFTRWFEQARDAGLLDPNAMTLATCDSRGQPSARVVLLKGADVRGFVFFTNYDSRKGRELARNARAALSFYWGALERQVRIEGIIEQVSDEESDEYFQQRPLGARLGAWASPQSQVIENRAALEARLQSAADRFGSAPPRPPYWGGYRLVPGLMEFWQGRTDRLHDRVCYRKSTQDSAAGWVVERLAP